MNNKISLSKLIGIIFFIFFSFIFATVSLSAQTLSSNCEQKINIPGIDRGNITGEVFCLLIEKQVCEDSTFNETLVCNQANPYIDSNTGDYIVSSLDGSYKANFPVVTGFIIEKIEDGGYNNEFPGLPNIDESQISSPIPEPTYGPVNNLNQPFPLPEENSGNNSFDPDVTDRESNIAAPNNPNQPFPTQESEIEISEEYGSHSSVGVVEDENVRAALNSMFEVMRKQVDLYCEGARASEFAEMCNNGDAAKDFYTQVALTVVACENSGTCLLKDVPNCRKDWIASGGMVPAGCQGELDQLNKVGSGQSFGICQTTNKEAHATGNISDLQGCLIFLNGGSTAGLNYSGAASRFALNKNCRDCFVSDGDYSNCFPFYTSDGSGLRYPQSPGTVLHSMCNSSFYSGQGDQGYFLYEKCKSGVGSLECREAITNTMYLYNNDNGLCQGREGFYPGKSPAVCENVGCTDDSLACWYGKTAAQNLIKNSNYANTYTGSSATSSNLGDFFTNFFEQITNRVGAQQEFNSASNLNVPGLYQVELSGFTVTTPLVKIAVFDENGNPQVRFFDDTNQNGLKDLDENFREDIEPTELQVELQEEGKDFTLNNGWNLVGFPLFISEDSERRASGLLESINSQGITATQIATFRGGKWRILSYREDTKESFGDNFELIPGEGYFVRSLQTGKYVLVGSDFTEQPKLDLGLGWNLANFINLGDRLTSKDVLQTYSSSDNVDAISNYQNGGYQNYILRDGFYYGNEFGIDDRKGYFLRVSE